jgi:hypothetical protein
MYLLDFDKLIEINLPYRMRKAIMLALIGVLNEASVHVYEQFKDYKEAIDIRLSHNGQVFLLEKILNDFFDNELRRIQILDLIVVSEIMVGNQENVNVKHIRTGAPVLGAVPLTLIDSDLFVGCKPDYYPTNDFVVILPSSIESQEVIIKNIVNEYKLAGKTYKIEYV